MFADDLVIISQTASRLQKGLDNLATYCDKWQLTLNVQKNKIYGHPKQPKQNKV